MNRTSNFNILDNKI